MKEFKSQVCTTKEQSQRLLDLGLKPETADMYHTTFYRDNVGYDIIQVRNERLPLLSQELPAWSLHRLMEICSGNYDIFNINVHKRDLYGFIISTFEHLKKQGKINKQYLKQ